MDAADFFCLKEAIFALLQSEEDRIRELPGNLVLEQQRETQVAGSEIFIKRQILKIAARTCDL